MSNIEDDFEVVTCSICGIDYDEGKVNLVDYDDDVCIHCEPKYKEELKTKVVYANLFKIRVAVFNSETNCNEIREGQGLTAVEAIVRAVENYYADDEIRMLIDVYGPYDLGGLKEYYEEKGIYISEPFFIN